MPDDITVADVASRAIELIKENDWGQGQFRHPQMCLVDALVAASLYVTHDNSMKLYSHTLLACKETLSWDGYIVGDIVRWNDDPARTKEDVILLLKKVANND